MEEKAPPATDAAHVVTVRVLFFSALRERLGINSLSVHVAEPASVDDVIKYLCNQFPAVNEFEPVLRVAVNCVYATGNEAVRDGDELAVITPVSGG